MLRGKSERPTSGLLNAAASLLFVVAALVGAANIGWNMYLLDTRPVASLGVPEHVPDQWLCGRVVGQPHCVLLTEQDRTINMWMQGSFLAILPLFLALAFWTQ